MAKRQAGYSKRALIDKLGVKPGHRVAILSAPKGFDALLGALPEGATRLKTAAADTDFIHLFTDSLAELKKTLPALRKKVAQNGMIWVSWPKKASGVATDVTEDRVREVALATDLVDVKVCAVDETWSGLKLVIPLKSRR